MELDEAAAQAVAKQFVEVLIAPSFSTAARNVFAAKQNVRLLEIPLGEGREPVRPQARGRRPAGAVAPMRATCSRPELRVVTRRHPTPKEMDDLMFAWRVAKFVKSNAIVFCGGGMTLGVGAGQMSRVDSARIASIKAQNAGLTLAGSAVASDAFFPFRDGLGRGGGRRRNLRDPAGRLDARRRGDRRRRRAQHRHGADRHAPLPALRRGGACRGAGPSPAAGRGSGRRSGLARHHDANEAQNNTMRILGIDPGLRTTGFGVLEKHGNKLAYVASGTIKSDGNSSLPERLKTLYDGIAEVARTYAPTARPSRRSSSTSIRSPR